MGRRVQEEKAMKCVICKQGETRPSETTVTLQREGVTLVFRNVPAEVCENCGEAYVNEATARELLRWAEEAVQTGVVMGIREYVSTTKQASSAG